MRAHNYRDAGGVQILCLLVMLLSFCSIASAEKMEFNFNILQQEVNSALIEFAEQADLTLMFPDKLVKGKSANKLIGTYSPQEGINILLAGTGLTPMFRSKILLSITSTEQSAIKGDTINL